MRIIQINSSANYGSHGRIANEIGELLISKGHDCVIAFGRTSKRARINHVRIGTRLDNLSHLLKTRVADRHGFGSINATKDFVRFLKMYNPDLIHLHNLHGYYLNIDILFTFLRTWSKPIIWTFHDCWPFTGHCSYFDAVNCTRWETGCYECPNLKSYPMSWFKDNSKKNYQDKKMLFCGLGKLLVVSPSIWLEGHLHNSFLNEYEIMVINNGIDLDIFNPLNDKTKRIKLKLSKKYILGVANSWSRRKGLEDILELSKYLDPEIDIVLVGLSNKQIINLPSNIIGINRINNPKELASLYAGAEVFINPTYVDNFPTVNLESLACGTPVITYNTGGSPETLDERTGLVIDKGDIEGLLFSINQFVKIGKIPFSHFCRDRAEKLYNKMDRFQDYTNLYESLLC